MKRPTAAQVKVMGVKPFTRWALVWPDGTIERSMHTTRSRARQVLRLFPGDLHIRIARVRITEVKKS